VKSISYEKFADGFLAYPRCGSTCLDTNMCKLESSQKDESRAQSVDTSKAYRKTCF